MDVLNSIIENTALNGMPRWYQALTLILFTIITTVVVSTYILLIAHGPDLAIRFSY